MSQPQPPDGLQQERTILAWRRTSLSLLVAAVIISRLALEDSAPAFAVFALAGFVVALWAVLVSLRGRKWSATSEHEPEFTLLLRDGILPAAIAVVAGSLCLVELTLAVVG